MSLSCAACEVLGPKSKLVFKSWQAILVIESAKSIVEDKAKSDRVSLVLSIGKG